MNTKRFPFIERMPRRFRNAKGMGYSLAAILAVAAIGITASHYSSAFTAFVSVQPEQGAIKSSAIIQSDTAASGGQAVAFRAAPASSGNGWPIQDLHVSSWSYARQQADAWASTRPADAAIMSRLAATPGARWFGSWNTNVQSDVHAYVSDAAANRKMPVLVAYNIPLRDCGSYSGGGAVSGQAYLDWTKAFVAGINGRSSVVILEPDALGVIGCLSSAQLQERYSLMKQATTMYRNAGAIVYINASHWVAPAEMASRLNQAGMGDARGLALNVSDFQTTVSMAQYGASVAAFLNNKTMVIDTSRNGNGPTADHEWCNPLGRALGSSPTTTATQYPLVDAYLWIKTPGESDGPCNGGPPAGGWWPEYALDMARRAGW